MHNSASVIPATALVLLGLGGCAMKAPPQSPPIPLRQSIAAGLQPGDAIRVLIWREQDLSGTFEVDDRGAVMLPLLGEHTVTGLSTDSLRQSLIADYRRYLQNPSIEVTLLRRINILGEVRNPGLYPVDATVSLADALAMAGGVSPNGNPKDIRLIRGGETLRQDLNQATAVSSLEIRSGDQIVVGERSWFSRNTGAMLGALVAAGAVVAAALISSN